MQYEAILIERGRFATRLQVKSPVGTYTLISRNISLSGRKRFYCYYDTNEIDYKITSHVYLNDAIIFITNDVNSRLKALSQALYGHEDSIF